MSRSYDNNGNVLTETDPNANTKIFAYDNLNRLTQKTLPDNVYSLAYDIRGNTTQVKNNGSQMNFEYDVGSRLESAQSLGVGALISLPQSTLNFSYDQNGNRVALTGPTGSFNYGYDGADRLTSMKNFKNETVSFVFDKANRMTSMTRPGSTTTLTFDSRNFVTSILHQGTVPIADIQYVMDAIGNRTSITTNNNQKNLGYDDNNQLTSATNTEAPGVVDGTNHSAETFSYDKIANRTTDQGGSYGYDNRKQRLLQDYRNTYVYDNNGNLISKQKTGLNGDVTNFTYTSENQLINIKVYTDGSNPSSITKDITYAYDALGRRVEKKVIDYTDSDVSKTFTRRFIYDGQEILAEFDGSNQLLARYTHSGLRTDDVLAVDVTQAGVDKKIAQTTGTFEYLKDAQGTITDITDTAGNKLQHYVYSAFGTLLSIQDANANEITNNPVLNTAFTYTGREKDSESGYYYYRARYYSADTGRFLSKDPHPGNMQIPSTVTNGYAYVGNNPMGATDPSGMSWWTEHGRGWAIDAGIAIAVIGLIVVSGGTLGPAALAVLSTAGGAMAAAVAMAAVQSAVSGQWGGTFWGNVETNFHFNFRVSMAFMAGGVLAADLWGGGLAGAGGNGLNGWIQSKHAIDFPIIGDVSGTAGSSTFLNGISPTDKNAAGGLMGAHEYGHTLQFIGLSAVGGLAGRAGPVATWGGYAGLGGLGRAGFAPWWESSASWWGTAL